MNSSFNEQQKIQIKILKIQDYWNQESMLIPNVFRLLSELEDSTQHVLEFQDLSNKIVLVQGNGQKLSLDEDDTKIADPKSFIGKRPISKVYRVAQTDRASRKHSKNNLRVAI